MVFWLGAEPWLRLSPHVGQRSSHWQEPRAWPTRFTLTWQQQLGGLRGTGTAQELWKLPQFHPLEDKTSTIVGKETARPQGL